MFTPRGKRARQHPNLKQMTYLHWLCGEVADEECSTQDEPDRWKSPPGLRDRVVCRTDSLSDDSSAWALSCEDRDLAGGQQRGVLPVCLRRWAAAAAAAFPSAPTVTACPMKCGRVEEERHFRSNTFRIKWQQSSDDYWPSDRWKDIMRVSRCFFKTNTSHFILNAHLNLQYTLRFTFV